MVGVVNAFRILWLRYLRFNAQVRYDDILKLEVAYRKDLRKIERSRDRAQAALEAANFQVIAAELATARVGA